MKIAVLSGKGGTGKTLVSVNLAALATNSIYMDCDVEEPNGHLFFNPENIESSPVLVKIPLVDQELCTGCQECVEFCKFHSLAYVKERLILFEDSCHSCGGCILFCPHKALSKGERIIGNISRGRSGTTSVISGVLNPGEVSGVPIIDQMFQDPGLENELLIIDSPPGSDCLAMESIKNVDYCVLVAEPTIFGLHNLEMICQLVELFNLPFGLVINKLVDNNNIIEDFARAHKIKILASLAYDKDL